jgi:hypothetical protein
MLASILRRVPLVWRWVVLRVLLLSMSVVSFAHLGAGHDFLLMGAF